MKKEPFDAAAFMRERREKLSRAYSGLSAEQIEERVQQALKDDPPWQRNSQTRVLSSSEEENRWLSIICPGNSEGYL